MRDLDTRLIAKTITMAGRTQDESARALEAAEDYMQQVQERFGEDSLEFEQADTYAQIASELNETVKTYLDRLRKARPARSHQPLIRPGRGTDV